MVPCTGFEPVYTALRGQRVKPLHQHGISQQNKHITILNPWQEKREINLPLLKS